MIHYWCHYYYWYWWDLHWRPASHIIYWPFDDYLLPAWAGHMSRYQPIAADIFHAIFLLPAEPPRCTNMMPLHCRLRLMIITPLRHYAIADYYIIAGPLLLHYIDDMILLIHYYDIIAPLMILMMIIISQIFSHGTMPREMSQLTADCAAASQLATASQPLAAGQPHCTCHCRHIDRPAWCHSDSELHTQYYCTDAISWYTPLLISLLMPLATLIWCH